MNDLSLIKKHYGEKMMHLCRELFSTILETEGLLYSILNKCFEPNKYLYYDIINDSMVNEFKNFIYSMIDTRNNTIIINKSVKELFEYQGYDFYECKSEEDIQSFKKYYKPREALCTFNGGRLDTNYVFFAVKKNASEIKREDFKYPSRQDEYGTSVISIQFTRGKNNTLSIKNRYNHTVKNPDATYSNNLENIIPGLTEAFRREYNFNINQSNNSAFELVDYVRDENGKYYKSRLEINGIYFCDNNIIIDNYRRVNDYTQKERYVFVDQYIVDLKENTIFGYKNKYDSFIDAFGNIKKINLVKSKETKNKTLTFINNKNEEIIVVINERNEIIEYKNNYIVEVCPHFLLENRKLRKIELKNAKRVYKGFLYYNNDLQSIDLSNVEVIESYFLFHNSLLKEINLPNVKIIGNDFLLYNSVLEKINVPVLENVGSGFLGFNTSVKEIDLPSVKIIEDLFMRNNGCLNKINAPLLEKIGIGFLQNNKELKNVSFPNLTTAPSYFLEQNVILESFDAPKLVTIDSYFLFNNDGLKELNLPNVVSVDDGFMTYNTVLEKIKMNKLKRVGNLFLYSNKGLEEISFPSLIEVYSNFLYSNKNIRFLYLPNLKKVGSNFLNYNTELEILELPNLFVTNSGFLENNNKLILMNLQSLERINGSFLDHNNSIEIVSFPSLVDCYSNLFSYNNSIKDFFAPKLKHVEWEFLKFNRVIERLYAPNLKKEVINLLVNEDLVDLLDKDYYSLTLS